MQALLIGTTLLEELGIDEYKGIIEGLLKRFGISVSLPRLDIERKALLLYSIGARFMAAESLSEIAKQALDNDLVLYVSPCVRYAFKELRFMTPITELTVHEFVLPKIELRLHGKALLACKRKFVWPEIKSLLASYGLELEEDCVFPLTKISSYSDYVRIRDYVARRYSGYVLTCPLQVPPFKESRVEYKELLRLAYDLVVGGNEEDREDEGDES